KPKQQKQLHPTIKRPTLEKTPNPTTKNRQTTRNTKNHKGHGLKITHPPNQTIQHKPTTYKHYQTNLTQTNDTTTNIRYKYDIQIQTKLTQHNQITITCPNCQTINTPDFPLDLTSTIQYGENIKAISPYSHNTPWSAMVKPKKS
ncbi:MAG: hypothetical protein FWC14_07835, partial [Candidatus Bathyarchaeota archaeon]|nr:hypothetical protein [Candidatus Termiticorpusculum sp.]